jgi:hypothetical protein
MALPLLIDLVASAETGNMLPMLLLVGYVVLGAAAYAGYGYRHSRLGTTAGSAILSPIGPSAAVIGPAARDDRAEHET